MVPRFRSLPLAVILVLMVACRSHEAGWPAREWDRFVSAFVETYFEANPLFAVYQGRHEFDGRFPD